MKRPVTYAEWCMVFDRFSNGDDTVLDELDIGSFDLDSGTAQRFYTRAETAYRIRKEKWLEKFQRSAETQNIRSADDFGVLLFTGKKNLIPLLKFAESKGLPEDLKTVLKKDLEDFVTEIKKSLKESSLKTIHDKEKMILMLNIFALPVNPIEAEKKESGHHAMSPVTKRTIIF